MSHLSESLDYLLHHSDSGRDDDDESTKPEREEDETKFAGSEAVGLIISKQTTIKRTKFVPNISAGRQPAGARVLVGRSGCLPLTSSSSSLISSRPQRKRHFLQQCNFCFQHHGIIGKSKFTLWKGKYYVCGNCKTVEPSNFLENNRTYPDCSSEDFSYANSSDNSDENDTIETDVPERCEERDEDDIIETDVLERCEEQTSATDNIIKLLSSHSVTASSSNQRAFISSMAVSGSFGYNIAEFILNQSKYVDPNINGKGFLTNRVQQRKRNGDDKPFYQYEFTGLADLNAERKKTCKAAKSNKQIEFNNVERCISGQLSSLWQQGAKRRNATIANQAAANDAKEAAAKEAAAKEAPAISTQLTASSGGVSSTFLASGRGDGNIIPPWSPPDNPPDNPPTNSSSSLRAPSPTLQLPVHPTPPIIDIHPLRAPGLYCIIFGLWIKWGQYGCDRQSVNFNRYNFVLPSKAPDKTMSYCPFTNLGEDLTISDMEKLLACLIELLGNTINGHSMWSGDKYAQIIASRLWQRMEIGAKSICETLREDAIGYGWGNVDDVVHSRTITGNSSSSSSSSSSSPSLTAATAAVDTAAAETQRIVAAAHSMDLDPSAARKYFMCFKDAGVQSDPALSTQLQPTRGRVRCELYLGSVSYITCCGNVLHYRNIIDI